MIWSIVDIVHELFFIFQHHVEEDDPNQLVPNSVICGESSDESMKECEEAAQEAKEFINFYEEVMESTFHVYGCQCEVVQTAKDYLTKTNIQYEAL